LTRKVPHVYRYPELIQGQRARASVVGFAPRFPRVSGQFDRRHHMRHLDAEIKVEPRPGGLRLRLVCATGETFYVDLQRDRAGALLEAIDRAIAPEPQTFGVLPIDPPGD